MSRPRSVDLFGGEGIAAFGYWLAGWDVTCVENDPERIAAFPTDVEGLRVVEGDATTYPLDGYDLATGSPPCTGHSTRAGLADRARGHEVDTAWMLPHTIARLRASGLPYIVENVQSASTKAHMDGALTLCGSMFGLVDGGWLLARHRLFLSNIAMMSPAPDTCHGRKVIGVYGDLTENDRACGGKRRPGGDMRAGVDRARRLLGAPWATPRGLALGIPTAMTRYLGEQAMAHLAVTA